MSVSLLQMSQDKESSMLKTEQRRIAGLAVQRVIEHYKPELERRGGVTGVYKEMAQYLAKKIGDPRSATDPAHRQGMDNYNTALRAILDPGRGQFENALHLTSNTQPYPYDYDQGKYISFKELLAYYWLAANDLNMPISDEELGAAPGNDEQEKRKNLIEGEKENLIANVALIRRAHNGDLGHYSKDSSIDEPSCLAGTYGRIVSSPISNSISKAEVNPVESFPMDLDTFILNKFKEVEKGVIDSYEFCVNQYFIGVDFEETEETREKSDQYKQFVDKTEKSKDEFLAYLEKTHGKTAMTPSRRKDAEALYENTLPSLKFFNEGVLPNGYLMDKLDHVVKMRKKREVFDKTKVELQSDHVKLYEGISSSISYLTHRLSSLELDKLSNEELNTIAAHFTEKHNDIINEKGNGDKEILDRFLVNYQIGLQEAGLDSSPSEMAQLNLRALYDNEKSKTAFDALRLKFDGAHAQFLEKVEQQRIQRTQKLFEEFSKSNLDKFADQSKVVKEKIQSDIHSVGDLIEKLDKGSDVQNITQYTGELVRNHSTSNSEIYDKLKGDFSEYCKTHGLELSLKEVDELDKNLSIKKTCNLEENEKMLHELNSQVHTLKKKHLLRDFQFGIQQIAVSLHAKIEGLKSKLENSAVDSRGRQQLEVLSEYGKKLESYTEKDAASQKSEFSDLIKKANNLSLTVRRMERDFEKIGYPGKLRTFLETAKNRCTKLLNYFRDSKFEVTKSLTKEDISKATVPITSAFNQFKDSIKQDATKMEKPSKPLGKQPRRV